MSITLEQVKKSEEITSYIRKADESLSALGFTEHSFAHVGLVSAQASAILKTLGYDDLMIARPAPSARSSGRWTRCGRRSRTSC